MKKQDYHAKLIVHGLPEMNSVQYRRFVDWLKAQVETFKRADSKDYSKRYVARLMK